MLLEMVFKETLYKNNCHVDLGVLAKLSIVKDENKFMKYFANKPGYFP